MVVMLLTNVGGTTRSLANCQKNGLTLAAPSIISDTPGTIDDFTTVGFVTANGTTDFFEMQVLVTGVNKTGVAAQFSMIRISS
jgi:hypothetical protein